MEDIKSQHGRVILQPIGSGGRGGPQGSPVALTGPVHSYRLRGLPPEWDATAILDHGKWKTMRKDKEHHGPWLGTYTTAQELADAVEAELENPRSSEHAVDAERLKK